MLTDIESGGGNRRCWDVREIDAGSRRSWDDSRWQLGRRLECIRGLGVPRGWISSRRFTAPLARPWGGRERASTERASERDIAVCHSVMQVLDSRFEQGGSKTGAGSTLILWWHVRTFVGELQVGNTSHDR
ncbi:hypothetical protein FB45DRAFT_878197 [Roridomyces roridus]|uniref:Uncharacterized protein n=1 Tax=Roridomyces roridus TaxID=1738132 RepID=A0AAD7B0R6_9AGAR|nr:hypothetical protein FB45DRAFT_878197 [Roridomyces roridus]